MGNYRCQFPKCKREDAEPIFTAKLSSVTKNPKTRQPQWYCEIHRQRKHRVSPVSGVRVRAYHGIHRNRTELKEVKYGEIA